MKKKSIVLLALVLILTVSVGGTLAWLAAQTGAVTNTFTPAHVTTAVDEVLDGTVKKDVRIQNTGDIDAYIRATYVVNWADTDGNIYGAAPTYDVNLNETDWAEVGGYYYCKTRVASGGFTPVLIESIAPKGEAPEGCTLQVTIIADGIQADGVDSTGTKAAVDAWGYGGYTN
ncbi:MAG: hypothetical protein ACOX81_06915 [Candidatus Heteroscillospira sp.]|jgi:hypothetical protein